ncbi:MAG: hypothetical protein Tsb0020_48100 [Haliangiales bacterium]
MVRDANDLPARASAPGVAGDPTQLAADCRTAGFPFVAPPRFVVATIYVRCRLAWVTRLRGLAAWHASEYVPAQSAPAGRESAQALGASVSMLTLNLSLRKDRA